MLFTPVHSYAPVRESSGTFFHDTDRERCRKRPSGRRNALRGFQGVRARDVMVNQAQVRDGLYLHLKRNYQNKNALFVVSLVLSVFVLLSNIFKCC